MLKHFLSRKVDGAMLNYLCDTWGRSSVLSMYFACSGGTSNGLLGRWVCMSQDHAGYWSGCKTGLPVHN